MTVREELPYWWLSTNQFQDFDKGKVIEDEVPYSWKLKPGDCIAYEVGETISGFARVLTVGTEVSMILHPSSEDLGIKVPGVSCTFQKIS